MNMIVRPFALVVFAAVPLLSTAHAQEGTASSLLPGGNELRCGVTDLVAFGSFIARKPTVSEFRAAYSCVTLVLPGHPASREFRPDNSRYFARVDEFGRIVGGNFE